VGVKEEQNKNGKGLYRAPSGVAACTLARGSAQLPALRRWLAYGPTHKHVLQVLDHLLSLPRGHGVAHKELPILCSPGAVLGEHLHLDSSRLEENYNLATHLKVSFELTIAYDIEGPNILAHVARVESNSQPISNLDYVQPTHPLCLLLL